MNPTRSPFIAACAAIATLLSSASTRAESPTWAPVSDNPRRLGIVSESFSALNTQYVKEVSLDACAWEDRPLNSVCVSQNPADAPSTWNKANAIACAAPTEPRPTTTWFDLRASEPCPLDPYISCSTQRWNWSDGRTLSGQSWNELHCPTNPAEWGTSLYTVPLGTWRSGHVFLQVPALFVHQTAKTVRAQVKLLVRSSRPYEPSGMPYRPMSVILALQERGSNGQWVERATREIADSTQYPGEHSLYEVQATIQPFTEVRLELRAGVVPTPVTQTELQYYKNYRLELDLVDARLVLPDCIPDTNNPGQCL